MPNRKMIDCGKFPSAKNCTLKMSGTESEVMEAAVAHACASHGHQDTKELRDQLRGAMSDDIT
jgi:hypothetical protein